MKAAISQMLFLCVVCVVIFSSSLYSQDYILAIHGGAGAMKRSEMTDTQAIAYEKALTDALNAGKAILEEGGQSLDAIVAAIRVLEESPWFNAGVGAVFTHEGHVELDASIMDGRDLSAGAVAGVQTIKSPLIAARAVMEHSPHVMLSGKGAEIFAKEQGLEMVENSYFHTESRLNALKRVIEREKERDQGAVVPLNEEEVRFKMGTVGAVALDKNGNLAAATSTGGMTNKRWGRIGDVPIIGSGTYANNESVAVSCTGHGEFFIRNVVGHDLSAMMLYGGKSLSEAADSIIHDKLKKQGASGGLIAIDKDGNVVMPFNSDNMFRAFVRSNGEMMVGISGK
jgi:beta-aspartyl-peptidase (threonine type)